MDGDITLASKADLAFDALRFLYVGFLGSLPAWARYTVLALFALTVVYGFVGWLRKRSADEPAVTAGVHEDEARASDSWTGDRGQGPDVGGSGVAGQGRAPGPAVAVPRREHEEHR
ncbi:hypothetical protein [Streptomyces roseolus]|uniref:hypothetical protein n=1 Tax=Streptomyces roseolus TaxID=67358 RepID=UPI00366055E3